MKYLGLKAWRQWRFTTRLLTGPSGQVKALSRYSSRLLTTTDGGIGALSWMPWPTWLIAEHVPGREQGLEEEVEVVFAPGPVALARLHGHEVEPACVIPAGEGFMVHAHEADHLERDAPHGQHGAEGDPALQEPGPFRGTAEGVAQMVPHHVDSSPCP